MTLLRKKTSSEGSENWEAPAETQVSAPEQGPAASPEQGARSKAPWLQEIGWYERARANAANKIAAGKAAASKADHSHMPAPMHRRELLADEMPHDAGNSRGPVQQQFRKPLKQRGSTTSFAIGAVATLIGIFCFIVAYDVTSGGGIRKSLLSTLSPSPSPSDKTVSLAAAKPAVLKQEAPQETITLVEKKPEAPAPQTQPTANPVQTATVEAPLKVEAPAAKSAKIIKASEPAPAKAVPEPPPVAVAPPPEIKPEVAAAPAPAPVAPKPVAPTVIALASPPALQKAPPAEHDVFKDCASCPEMVAVQTGRFQMGAAEGDNAAQPNELPQHQVSITKAFAIGRFEITAGDWAQCVADKGCQPLALIAGWDTPRQPAIQVSWDEITKQYLPWLSRVTGKSYRLPTEAEWEFAAKGGSAAGSAEVQEFRNLAMTVAVGSLKPNSLGLYDMQGNVWEWVADCWNANYNETPVDGSAAISGDCSLRVSRGGSWASSSPSLRATKRGWNKPTTQNNTLGFRVVRPL